MQPDRPVASAQTPVNGFVGQTVTLDGSTSLGAIDSYAWRQTVGPAAILSGANTAKATFTASVTGTYTFQLVVTGPGGSSTDRVVVSAQAETLSNLSVRYRTRGEWRLTGTSSLAAGQRVAVVLGADLRGQVIATATVDAAGLFDMRPTTPNPGTTTTVSIVTTTGGQALAVPITITS